MTSYDSMKGRRFKRLEKPSIEIQLTAQQRFFLQLAKAALQSKTLIAPAMTLPKQTLLPMEKHRLDCHSEEQHQLFELAMQRDLECFIYPDLPADPEDKRPADRIGCLCQIIGVEPVGQGWTVDILVTKRAYNLVRWNVSGQPWVRILPWEATPVAPHELEQVQQHLLFMLKTVQQGKGFYLAPFEEELKLALEKQDALRFGYRMLHVLRLEWEDQARYLRLSSLSKRMTFLLNRLAEQGVILGYHDSIMARVNANIESDQKEYYLRHQLEVIHQELRGSDGEEEWVRWRKQLEDLPLPESDLRALSREIDRLEKLPSGSPDAGVIRNYLQTVFDLPWQEAIQPKIQLKEAREALESQHYGLDKVKTHILEVLAVYFFQQQAKQAQKPAEGSHQAVKRRSPILCLVGPPGVGKTTIARSVAQALGRPYHRISLGGVRDEAEIRGHRRTYLGAMPGRLIETIRRAGCRNPLILLDEVDKMGTDHRGDPAAALLEALDPDQNATFRDHYLDLPFDLSDVFFLMTANDLQTVPPALKDRMEVLELTGYTVAEKTEIAKRHLLPKLLKEAGLDPQALRITPRALTDLIEVYTREAGVRQLERLLNRLIRQAALASWQAQDQASPSGVRVTPKRLKTLLGPPQIHRVNVPQKPEVGWVTGLAWTAAGGDCLAIEVQRVPGQGKLVLTGQLGQVMQESAQVAFAYVRSQAAHLGIQLDEINQSDFHVHVPEGAIPKDGPSAGITLVTALASALSRKPVKPGIAMTGEVTLRGHVLAIGGLREKLLAAQRAGIKTVYIPAQNQGDYEALLKTESLEIEVLAVDQAQAVLKAVLLDPQAAEAD